MHKANLMKNIIDYDKRPEFVMLAGIPGSGKSTYAEELKQRGYIHISSDNIRLELGFGAGQGNGVVFDAMAKRTVEALSQGKSVIYDATNLIRKNRVHILSAVEKTGCSKKCVLFSEPYEVCLERNSKREGFARVPEEAMKHMLLSFQVPLTGEGFDNIQRIQTEKGRALEEYLDMADGFSQKNSHHDLELLEHMFVTKTYITEYYSGEDKNILETAALYHDIGKLMAQGFKDAKGNPSEEAHYYGHENAGAYMFLSSDNDLSETDRLTVAALINFHMRPYLQIGEKKLQQENNILGVHLRKMLDMLHDADVSAKRDITKEAVVPEQISLPEEKESLQKAQTDRSSKAVKQNESFEDMIKEAKEGLFKSRLTKSRQADIIHSRKEYKDKEK